MRRRRGGGFSKSSSSAFFSLHRVGAWRRKGRAAAIMKKSGGCCTSVRGAFHACAAATMRQYSKPTIRTVGGCKAGGGEPRCVTGGKSAEACFSGGKAYVV